VNVLIIRAGALGDTLMLMPSIAALKDSADIILAARSPGLELLKPFVACGSDFEGPDWHGLFAEAPVGLHSCEIPSADCVVAFLGDTQGHIKRSLQACFPGAAIHVFPVFPSRSEQIHVAFYLARCLQAAGLPINAERALEMATERALMGRNEPSTRYGPIVLHPGSGSLKKNFPPHFWLELVHALQSRAPGHQIVLLMGPAEERQIASFSRSLQGKAIEVHRSPARDKLLTLLGEAPIYVGQDSGITHLAALLGTPTVALFRSSSVHRWHPLGPCVKVIKAEKGDSTLVRDVLGLVGSTTGQRRKNRPSKDPIKGPNKS
jgi:hypothetical protein